MIECGPNGSPLLTCNPADEGRDPCEACGAIDTEGCHQMFEVLAEELPGIQAGTRILCDSCDEKRREDWNEIALENLHKIAKAFNIVTDIHPTLIAEMVIATTRKA